ncbi:MAG: metal-dependent transcriptional regulator [Actinomycetota bacterium]
MSPRSPDLSELNPASKEYLEAIYELGEEGRRILQARIGERLGLAAATVSEGIKRLVADGHIRIKDGHDIELTDKGQIYASALVRRHRLAERMLVDILGIPWHLCHEQAEDWEKVMTTEVEEAILAKLEGDLTCPHGNPIPGTEPAVAWSDLKPVAAMGVGESSRLSRLLEDVELNHDVLKYLEESNLMPGRTVTLTSVAPDGTLSLEVEGRGVALGSVLAGNLWVLAR